MKKTKLYVPPYLVEHVKKICGNQFEIVVITKLSERKKDEQSQSW
ncbi:hypothetical protein LCGC14_2315650 [marine sediment metagenome]|uniref:Uncharacterized protein n=1 Tax=marine sediment metagenome TaxID=412755 RepID=A0A0F9EWV0_9ZZZZ